MLECFIFNREFFQSCVLAAMLCPTLSDPVDCSPPGSSVDGILQARILEWVAILFSRGSSQSRDWTWVSRIAGRFFIVWTTREATYLSSFISPCPPSFQPKWHLPGNRSKMELLVLSPMSANQDIILNIIAILTSRRNVTFNQSIWNYLVSITEVICLKALCLSPKEMTSPETIHALLE